MPKCHHTAIATLKLLVSNHQRLRAPNGDASHDPMRWRRKSWCKHYVRDSEGRGIAVKIERNRNHKKSRCITQPALSSEAP